MATKKWQSRTMCFDLLPHDFERDQQRFGAYLVRRPVVNAEEWRPAKGGCDEIVHILDDAVAEAKVAMEEPRRFSKLAKLILQLSQPVTAGKTVDVVSISEAKGAALLDLLPGGTQIGWTHAVLIKKIFCPVRAVPAVHRVLLVTWK